MDKISLKAQKRTIVGRKVKKLRKEGLVPGVLFGKDFKSVSLKVSSKDYEAAYVQVGNTGIVDLSLDDKTYPVLIKNVQVHPVTSEVLHIDLHKVDLTEKVTANIPIEVVGTAPAVDQNVGVLLELLKEIEVEALPQNLPKSITVDVSELSEVNQRIKLKEVSLGTGVETSVDLEQDIVKIGDLAKEEPVPETTEDAEGDQDDSKDGEKKESDGEGDANKKDDDSNTKNTGKTDDSDEASKEKNKN